MAAPAAPLALICSHKRTIANGHARETSAACVDGDFAVTASWDGELRVWREHSDAVARAFRETAHLAVSGARPPPSSGEEAPPRPPRPGDERGGSTRSEGVAESNFGSN